MAHLNCFPATAVGVNFWFFIAVPFGGGCWYKAKCKMLLRKIDGEKNPQNYGFSAKLRNGDDGDMLHNQRQFSRTRTVIFRRYDTSSTSNSRNLFVYVSKITINAPAAAPRLMEMFETSRCRRRKHHQRRPSDDQD